MSDSVLDEIDRKILRILAQGPRKPYSEIAADLEKEGYEMSGEGIRYRVSQLFDETSILLLTAPKEHGWEVLRIFISTEDYTGAKEAAVEELSEMPCWLVCRLIGSFDLYAVATVKSNREADQLISDVRELECIANVDYALETGRETNIEKYLEI